MNAFIVVAVLSVDWLVCLEGCEALRDKTPAPDESCAISARPLEHPDVRPGAGAYRCLFGSALLPAGKDYVTIFALWRG
jgi:hypothetical protein